MVLSDSMTERSQSRLPPPLSSTALWTTALTGVMRRRSVPGTGSHTSSDGTAEEGPMHSPACVQTSAKLSLCTKKGLVV